MHVLHVISMFPASGLSPDGPPYCGNNRKYFADVQGPWNFEHSPFVWRIEDEEKRIPLGGKFTETGGGFEGCVMNRIQIDKSLILILLYSL